MLNFNRLHVALLAALAALALSGCNESNRRPAPPRLYRLK